MSIKLDWYHDTNITGADWAAEAHVFEDEEKTATVFCTVDKNHFSPDDLWDADFRYYDAKLNETTEHQKFRTVTAAKAWCQQRFNEVLTAIPDDE